MFEAGTPSAFQVIKQRRWRQALLKLVLQGCNKGNEWAADACCYVGVEYAPTVYRHQMSYTGQEKPMNILLRIEQLTVLRCI
jgi:hypothetical protein